MSRRLTEVRSLCVDYRRNTHAISALKDVDFQLAEGERLAVIGESGSGKSTLALALAGLLPPTARVTGDIRWPGGKPLPGKDFGVVFQDPGASLNPVLTVGEQVAEGARRHLGLGRRAARDHARSLLERVQIPQPEHALSAFPHQFSGGQRQRIAIAAAIAAGPRLLIADEATSALDMLVQAEIVHLLNDLVRESGMTLLFITHDIALASGLADRIAVFRDARLVEIDPTSQVLAAPHESYTRQLIATHIDLAAPPLIASIAP